jgi:hypothetical protein
MRNLYHCGEKTGMSYRRAALCEMLVSEEFGVRVQSDYSSADGKELSCGACLNPGIDLTGLSRGI